MEAVYLIPLPVNQVSVPVGEVPAMVAKAMHPKDWDFWEGRKALFNQLVARVWHRVSRNFPGEIAAANEVHSILKSQNEPKVSSLMTKLSGNNFYQLYLAGVHKRLLSKAVGDGDITLIDRTPYGASPVTPDDFGTMEFRETDRVKVPELGKYLRPYGVMIDESVSVAAGGKEGPDKKPRVLVDEKRGKVILRVLEKMDLDPENLPAYTMGRSTVKAKISKKVWEVDLPEFAPDGDPKKFNKAFERAWSWLARNGRINHPRAEK